MGDELLDFVTGAPRGICWQVDASSTRLQLGATHNQRTINALGTSSCSLSSACRSRAQASKMVWSWRAAAFRWA